MISAKNDPMPPPSPKLAALLDDPAAADRAAALVAIMAESRRRAKAGQKPPPGGSRPRPADFTLPPIVPAAEIAEDAAGIAEAGADRPAEKRKSLLAMLREVLRFPLEKS